MRITADVPTGAKHLDLRLMRRTTDAGGVVVAGFSSRGGG
jgi:hypothetical protein